MDIKESFLATWHETETMRVFVARMFPALERTDAGKTTIRRMARELAEQTSFPDLECWEESTKLKADAAAAVRALKVYLAQQQEVVHDERAAAEARRRGQQQREERSRQHQDLDALRQRLDGLALQLGTQGAGYAFEQ